MMINLEYHEPMKKYILKYESCLHKAISIEKIIDKYCPNKHIHCEGNASAYIKWEGSKVTLNHYSSSNGGIFVIEPEIFNKIKEEITPIFGEFFIPIKYIN
jgi:hypothetical protein